MPNGPCLGPTHIGWHVGHAGPRHVPCRAWSGTTGCPSPGPEGPCRAWAAGHQIPSLARSLVLACLIIVLGGSCQAWPNSCRIGPAHGWCCCLNRSELEDGHMKISCDNTDTRVTYKISLKSEVVASVRTIRCSSQKIREQRSSNGFSERD